MKAIHEYDAVIVGGGPAGLAAGIALARSGIRALLVERRKLPHAKVCGEGLMPVGLRALERLGVDLAANSGGQAFRGIRYSDASGGKSAQAYFAEGPGLGLPRRELAAQLFETARSYVNDIQTETETGGALEIRDETLCDRVRREDDGFWTVRAGESVVRARLLIGADGVHSSVRRAVSLERDLKRGDPRRWGARWHFPIAPWTEGFVEVRLMGLLPGVECYITPVGERETGVAFLWDRARFRPDGGETLLASLLAAFPEVRQKIAGLAPLPDGGAIGPLMHRARSVVAPGVVLLGDAAGYLDAATGEGLSLAFEEVLALEARVAPVLRAARKSQDAQNEKAKDEQELARALRSYRRDYRRITANYFITTRLVLWLGRRPAWMRRVVAGLRASPRFFQHVLSVNMGTRRLAFAPPFALLRFIRGVLFSR